jgi:thiazole tautomerase (transcriptional regulator TenI)
MDPIIEMKEELHIPVYAIGGITVDRIEALRQVKADGIAVMSGIFSAENPFASTRQFDEAINNEEVF